MTERADIEAALAALRAARASGAREVTYQNGANGVRQTTVFKTDAEIADAIAYFERRLARLVQPTPKMTYIQGVKMQ